MAGPPRYKHDGSVTADGYAVNTAQSSYQPSGIAPAPGGDPDLADPTKNPLPPQTALTVGDTLSEKGVSWAWYGGAYTAAVADGRQPPDAKRRIIYSEEDGAPNFQAHHQPLNAFASFAPGTKAREEHFRDGADLFAAVAAGTLPAVAFYKPQGTLNEHPGYADVLSGDEHIADLVRRIQAGPQWKSTLIIVTYDENGGFWDHVPPPAGDRWGPGTRIPAILVSPFAKRGFVDSTPMDTTSILKFLTRRFGLRPLPGVRAAAGDLTSALEFR
jgi:acid phosphatase